MRSFNLKTRWVVLVLISLLAFQSFAVPQDSTSKVVVIVLENTDYNHASKEMPFQRMAEAGAVFTQFSAVATVSQPNYIALTSGDMWGVDNNKPHDLKVRHLGDLLEEKNLDWRAYGDDYPGDGKVGNCFTQKENRRYVRKHFPFVSYVNVSTNPDRCAKLLDSKYFERDVLSGNLPEFSLFTPSMDNDGHDTGVSYAARWFSTKMFPLMSSEQGRKITWILTFDESVGRDYHILTIAVGPRIKAGSKINEAYNHYSLLRTFEELWGLDSLGRNDTRARVIPELLN